MSEYLSPYSVNFQFWTLVNFKLYSAKVWTGVAFIIISIATVVMEYLQQRNLVLQSVAWFPVSNILYHNKSLWMKRWQNLFFHWHILSHISFSYSLLSLPPTFLEYHIIYLKTVSNTLKCIYYINIHAPCLTSGLGSLQSDHVTLD